LQKEFSEGAALQKEFYPKKKLLARKKVSIFIARPGHRPAMRYPEPDTAISKKGSTGPPG